MTVLAAQPALAYRLNRWLSLDAGVAIERAAVVRKSAVPNWFDPGYSDGSVNAALHAWGIGASAGILLEPSDRTRFGISYRSRVDFQMQGKTTLENVGPTTAARLAGSISGATPLHLPQGVNVSVVHSFTRKLTFLADGGWTNWRHFGEKTSQLPGGGSVVTDSNWRDTWRAGAGMRFRISQKLMLQSGVSYDSSPVSSWNRTPDIPVDRQVRLAAGAQYAVRPSMLLGVSYMHLDLGKGDINNVPSVFTGPITGRYSPAKVQFLSFTCTLSPAE